MPVLEPAPLVFQPGHRPGGARSPAGGSAPATGARFWTDAPDTCTSCSTASCTGNRCRRSMPMGLRTGVRPDGTPSERHLPGGCPARPGVHQFVVQRAVQDLQTMTTAHHALLTRVRGGLAGEQVAPRPWATGTRLLDVNSLRAGTKLVLMLVLLLGEEGLLGLPGGSQVAFYATFFARTANLGRRNTTDLVGLAGLLGGFAYGVVAALLTSRVPQFPLLLALVFLGGVPGQSGLSEVPALRRRRHAGRPGAALRLPGDDRARVGLIHGGADALCGPGRRRLHGGGRPRLSRPVLPMRHLRASIAAALRDTAMSFGQLFGAPRSTGQGRRRAWATRSARARSARRRPLPARPRARRPGVLWHSGWPAGDRCRPRVRAFPPRSGGGARAAGAVVPGGRRLCGAGPGAPGAGRPAIRAVPTPRGSPRTGPLGAGCLRPLGACVRRGRPGAGWRHRSVEAGDHRPLSGADRGRPSGCQASPRRSTSGTRASEGWPCRFARHHPEPLHHHLPHAGGDDTARIPAAAQRGIKKWQDSPNTARIRKPAQLHAGKLDKISWFRRARYPGEMDAARRSRIEPHQPPGSWG